MSVTIRMTASSQSASLIRGFTFIVIWFSIDAYSFKAFQLPPFYRYINWYYFLLPPLLKNIYALNIIY
jgi:hypothetical protein